MENNPLKNEMVRIAAAEFVDARPRCNNIDAALENRGAPSYSTDRLPFAEVVRRWTDQIDSEELRDHAVSSPFTLSVDPRDGALVRGAGGLCYTPHAWRQLLGLFRAGKSPIPTEVTAADAWHSPLARHFGFDDVKRASNRPTDEEAVLRTFQIEVDGRPYRALRAVVSGRHSLHHTDDLAIAQVLEGLADKPVEGRVGRSWNKTWGNFVLDAGDDDVRFGFSFTNSETGCGSMSFHGGILIRAVDAVVVRPDSTKQVLDVSIASEGASAHRRHTLPRKDGKVELTDAQRGAISAKRIEADVQAALKAAHELGRAWARAKKFIRPQLVPLAKMTEVTPEAVEVLSDVLLDLGAVPEAAQSSHSALVDFANTVAQVMADDERLRALPHGSDAHLAATLAVLAGKADNWVEASQIQKLAGTVLAPYKMEEES